MKNFNTKILLSGLAFSMFSSYAAFSQNEEVENMQPSAEKEKCYGIAKAGKNDCASADGAHSCAGYAKKDSSGVEWVLMPKGTCDKIVGASSVPAFPEGSTAKPQK